MAKKSVLIVEDDRDISELVSYNLQREGYNIACLYDGAHVVEFVRTAKPDLIILDLMLPVIDGLEICCTLKNNPGTRSVPVIMLTAKNEEADVMIGMQMGADDYIPKPFSPKVLVARVNTITRRLSDLKQPTATPEAARSLRRKSGKSDDYIKTIK